MNKKFSEAIFRFRGWVLILLIVIGFLAPWHWETGYRAGSAWLYLAGVLARNGIFSIAYASIAVMSVAILLALLGALLRTWGAAVLGHGIVSDKVMHGERVIADGPFRYMRNPLYAGMFLNVLALSILMPPFGALFAIVTVGLWIAALVWGEEQHLTRERGEAYLAYVRRVPRFLPSLTPRVAASGVPAHWGRAFRGEIYYWGVVIVFLAFAGRYNVTILDQGVLISLGLGFMARGIWRSRPAVAAAESTEI